MRTTDYKALWPVPSLLRILSEQKISFFESGLHPVLNLRLTLVDRDNLGNHLILKRCFNRHAMIMDFEYTKQLTLRTLFEKRDEVSRCF